MINKKKEEKNFLLYIPEKKHTVYEERNNKVYLVFHHNKLIEKVTSKLFRKPRVSDIELDDLGSSVWKLIDGKNNVYDITQKLQKQYGEKCEPINERLILYLRYLNRRNWIKFRY